MILVREKYGQEYSPEVFNKWFGDSFYNGQEDHEEGEKDCFTIMNNGYKKEGVAKLREICGITGDFEYDAEAVEAIQKARYASTDWNSMSVEPPKERTFIMIKPDGVQRGLIGKIIARFEERGFKMAAMKVCQPGKEHLEKHYADLSSKKFFPGLIEYMNSGPVCAMVWEGDNAVATGRKMLGATKPFDSEPGTIRGDFCIDVGRNICHGSDAVESA